MRHSLSSRLPVSYGSAALGKNERRRKQMSEFQHVRLSPAHPRVHLISTAVTEENKMDNRATLCGAGLRPDTVLGVKDPVTCERCLAMMRSRGMR